MAPPIKLPDSNAIGLSTADDPPLSEIIQSSPIIALYVSSAIIAFLSTGIIVASVTRKCVQVLESVFKTSAEPKAEDKRKADDAAVACGIGLGISAIVVHFITTLCYADGYKAGFAMGWVKGSLQSGMVISLTEGILTATVLGIAKGLGWARNRGIL
ncbi:hypothetical protein BU16DRAFT_531358 [Lophium mytilinum]|uniref:Uncharacterized protein n=1 Tax=Lophium mytilinum TaxID=390894 RepID=A0A6A6QC31_9PEZI|nr:hypothetical protein BU16DRAFT_531358 [Lophium mytilinum]